MIDSILNSGVSSGVVDHLGWVLLHSVWQFALIALICAATMAVTSPRTAAARYASYGGMLLLMGLLPLATWIAIGSRAEPTPSNVPAVVVGEPHSLTANDSADVVALTPAVPIADVSSVDLDTPSAEEPAVTIPSSTPAFQNESAGPAHIPFRAFIAPWLNVIVGVWCLGVAVFSLRPAVSWRMVQRLKSKGVAGVGEDVTAVVSHLKEQLGLHRSVRVLQSTLVNSPIVVGCFRSVILLPTSLLSALPVSQLESILAHELAHVRRFDYLINLLQTGMETLFFYHPAVWWMSRRMRIERENCCDDVVISVLGDRVQYGRALLAIEEHRGAAAALALGAKDGALLSRVGRILSVDDAGPLKSSPVGIIAVATACLLAVTSGVFLITTVQADAEASAGPLHSVNGNDDQPESDAPFRLPDHWIIEDLRWVKNDTELITVALQGGVDIRRWDVAKRKLLSEIKLQSDVHGRPIRQGSLRLSPDGLRILGVTDLEYSKRIAGTKETRFVFVWDTRNGKLLNKLPIPQKDWAYNTVSCLDCSADGSIVVAGLSTDFDRMGHGSYSGHGIAWDADSGKVLSRFEIEKSSDVSCVSVTPDGKRFATCTRGHRVGVWETSTGNQLQDFTQHALNWSSPDPKIIKNNLVREVAFRPDGRQLAIAGTFGIKLVDVDSGELTASIDVPYRYGSPEITYTADGQQLARSGVRPTEDSPYTVAVYSSESGEWLTDLIHGSDCVAFAKSGQRIAIADADFYEAVSVWPIEHGEKLGPLPGPKRRPRINRVEENTHTTGDTAESFVKRWQPVWGEPVNGIQYGLAFTSEQPASDGTPPQTPQFDEENRMTMAAFLKNASDRPIQIDSRPDMFGSLPLVRSTGGTVVRLGKQKLIGSPSHYRDVLEPGEHFGPLYLQVAIGSSPRPNQQYWTPFWPNPVHGEYAVAHKVTVLTRPPQAKPDVEKPDWTSDEVTSGWLNFRIGDEKVASGDSGGNSEGSN